MTVYVVNIRRFTVKKDLTSKKVYPIDTPPVDSEIILEVKEKFPAAFEWWKFSSNILIQKHKTVIFKTISKMFKYFDENGIDPGISLANFYKQRRESDTEPPLEGELIYSYRNITIHRQKIG